MKKTAVLALLTFASIGYSANIPTDGVTLDSIGQQVSIFSVGPDTLTIQTGTNQYQTVQAYGYYLRPLQAVGAVVPELNLTYSEAVTQGEFNLLINPAHVYGMIAALSTLSAPTLADQLDLQEDIWDQTEPVFPLNAQMITYLTEAESALSSINLNDYSFLEQSEGDRTIQPFVYYSGATVIDPPVGTPEPATMAMIGLGLIGMGMIIKRRQICAR